MTANEQDDERAARLERVTLLALDHDVLERFITAHRDATRESLVASGHVLPSAPPKGDAVLLSDDRGEQGDELLEYAVTSSSRCPTATRRTASSEPVCASRSRS